MQPIKVFFVEPQGDLQLYLRRYTRGDHKCNKTDHYCNAQTEFMRVAGATREDGYFKSQDHLKPPNGDPRWPVRCDSCGRPFDDADPFQLHQDTFYKDQGGREYLQRDLPVGACYDAWWYGEHWAGPDGRHLIVIIPHERGKTEWCIDSQAKNCTMKDDHVHRCWVRHGSPENGDLHVDKNGFTCAAGAGSIQVPGFHGFLHNGHLREA